jgi:hypothetical protein
MIHEHIEMTRLQWKQLNVPHQNSKLVKRKMKHVQYCDTQSPSPQTHLQCITTY